MLKRGLNRPYGGLWNLPAGKFERGELPVDCACREVFEETGIVLDKNKMGLVRTLYISIPNCNYVFHIFRQRFEARPEIDLNLDEHTEFLWVTIDEALALPLIVAGEEILRLQQE